MIQKIKENKSEDAPEPLDYDTCVAQLSNDFFAFASSAAATSTSLQLLQPFMMTVILDATSLFERKIFKNEAEYSCPCTSPETLSCELHVGKHMKIPNRAHAFNSVFVDPCQGTKEEILKFLTRESSKNSKLRGKVLESFSKRILESKNDIEELLNNLDSSSAEISNYFTKISQAQKISKSEQDPILGLLSLQPDEAIEKLKKIIPANQEWSNSAKLFCVLSEKIEKIIECFIGDKFEAYLDKRLSNIENTLQEHIKSANEEHKKIIDSTNDQIANINDSISKLIIENKKSERDFKDWKEETMLKTKNEIDLLNSQIISTTQDLIKNNEAKKAKKIQELREKRSDILNRPNDPELEQDFRRAQLKFSSDICADDPTLQQAYQDYANAYRQKTSLYTIIKDNDKTNLIIYDTENDSKEVRIVETPEPLDHYTCIAQLPDGGLFCFGNCRPSGISLMIDENYRVRELPSGTPCKWSSAIYFKNNFYCFGGWNNGKLTLSERFDLNENRWIKLKPLPQADYSCNSVIFSGNIVISGKYNKNLLRYPIGNNTFATIPYDFQAKADKILLSAERLYLIECSKNGSIYESELSNDTAWRRIGDSIINDSFAQVYLSYNKGGINIAKYYNDISYFKFNLESKIITKLD